MAKQTNKAPGQRPSGQPPKSSTMAKSGTGKPGGVAPVKQYGTRPGSTKTFNEGAEPTKKTYVKPVVKGKK